MAPIPFHLIGLRASIFTPWFPFLYATARAQRFLSGSRIVRHYEFMSDSAAHSDPIRRTVLKRLLGILLLTCLVGCMALPAEADDQALGMLLVKNFFALVLSEDWPVLERHLAACFQSFHSDGARDRAQEMALFKKLKLGSYKLSNFKTT
jgi:hypothetical protein